MCGSVKELEEFSKDRRQKYEKDSRCHECRSLERRLRERRRRHVVQARAAKRRAIKKKAIPSWINYSAVRTIYRLCRERTIRTGIPHEVDHIVPLNSELVCGLHWEGNLAIIPARENHDKSNKYWPDMW